MLPFVIVLLTGTPVFAVAFTVVTYVLGLFSQRFRPTEAKPWEIFLRFIPVAAIYLLLAMLGFRGIGLLGLVNLIIMTAAYRYFFDADWIHALIIGILGGILGSFCYAGVLAMIIELGMRVD